MRWRTWLAFAGAGSAVALAYRGDWIAVAAPAACVLMPVAWRVRAELLAVREMLRAAPVPGRHRRRGRPRELRRVAAVAEQVPGAAGIRTAAPR